ncbi:MAG: hypothetical protein KF799_09535 [Bdellovibrionales bacterium]|nr:hypothetical protein [Bdellovibrionales bacterium]
MTPKTDLATPEQPSSSIVEGNDGRHPYAEVLWKTTLGKSYYDLLFSEYPRELFPSRCERLALRVISEVDKFPARVAAIQIMSEDIYVTGKMNDDVRSRIQLLDAAVQKDRGEAQRSAVKTVLQHIPYVFLASLPWGSPLIRAEVSGIPKGWANYAVARLHNKPALPYKVQWRSLFSSKVFENYEIGRPATLFFQMVAPFSIIELFLVQDIAGNLTADTSLEAMIMMADF